MNVVEGRRTREVDMLALAVSNLETRLLAPRVLSYNESCKACAYEVLVSRPLTDLELFPVVRIRRRR